MRRVFWSLILLCLIGVPAVADEQVPAYLIRLPAAVKTVFVADTSASKFHRFVNRGGTDVTYRGDSYMSIGQKGDGKRRNGDRKTPLGIYFVTEQLDTSRMHEKYGITAFTLDYPNALDRRMERTGDGIWVHGVDRRGGERPAWDTDGCIALPNENLAALEGDFLPNVTPVLISRSLAWVPRRQVAELRRELDAVVSLWVDSQQNGDIHSYLTLYDDDFRHWGMSKTEWIAFRNETLASRSVQEIAISEVLLLADPSADDIYLSRFRMATEEASPVVVTKRLYWRRDARGSLKIIAEDSG
jgi:murein L,D-transpeptidase YafK